MTKYLSFKYITALAIVPIVLMGMKAVSVTPNTNAPYISKKGGFEIVFPTKPVASTHKIKTEIGNITMYMFMEEASTTKVYIAAYSDYPKSAMKNADVRSILKSAKDAVVQQFDATVKFRKEDDFQGYPCIDFSSIGSEYHTIYKLVMVQNRMYQVAILQKDEAVSQADSSSFIGSFKIRK